MRTEILSKNDARQFLASYHNLNGSQQYCGSDGIIKYFAKAGSIQYDPLNVVGRNADLVLQSKIKDYKPEMLHSLLYKERLLVDGFDKEMCIYMSEEFPKFARIREASGIALTNTMTHRNQLDALNILDEVRDFVLINGATGTKDLSIGGHSREGSWGPKKLSSAALDYLYTIGELCVVNKNGTQKQYDFTKKVMPLLAEQQDSYADDDDFLTWYVKRRIGSTGMLWDRTGGAWQGHFLSNKVKREQTLSRLLEEGEIIQLLIEDIKSPFYVRKEDTPLFEKNDSSKHVKFLAPLDNLLWDREMVAQLFGFEYRWEVYTPADKRKYGYYVLPVLYGDQLIARFEPEKVQKNAPLKIKSWWWEPNVQVTSELLDAIDAAIYDFCRYLDAEYSKDYLDVLRNNL